MPASDDEIDDRRDAIRKRVREAIKGDCAVVYDAFPFDEAGRPIDNLDGIACEGACQFVDDSGGTVYKSEIHHSPTWLDVAVLANDLIRTTGDKRHVFLERIQRVARRGKTSILEFDMGS